MKVQNIKSIPEQSVESPKGRYKVIRQDISGALGCPKDAGPEKGGHPFAVERARVPAGKQAWPLHSHAAQWELYIVQSGRGELVCTDSRTPIGPGDTFMCSPGEAHAIAATGDEDLEYLIIANNPMADVIEYPTSGKLAIKPRLRCFKTEVDYYSDEE